MDKNNQFFMLPSKMTESSDLKPTDLLVYLYLKSYDNPQHECYPSFEKLSKRSGAAISTLRKCVSNLEEAKYIKVKKVGRSNYYYFEKPEMGFEKFYREFLDNEDLTFKEKAYVASTQQYMYKDIQNIGKVSYSNSELANILNVSESTVYRVNKELVRKDYLRIYKEAKRNLETGCAEELKVFNLEKLGQAALWLVEDNSEKIDEHTKNIKDLEEAIKSRDILIEKMDRRISELEKKEKENYTI